MSVFRFRDFSIRQSQAALKVGTDAMLLGALIDASYKSDALDIGTGTGVLALMVAQQNPELIVSAIEVEEQAQIDAGFNFASSPYSKRLQLLKSDFIHYDFKSQFDLIFSNPPFYTTSLKGEKENLNLAKHVSELRPSVLVNKVKTILAHQGSFWIIWPADDFEEIQETVLRSELYLKTKINIYGKPGSLKRIVAEFVKEKSETKNSEITVRNESGKYTPEYIRLTQDFHDRAL